MYKKSEDEIRMSWKKEFGDTPIVSIKCLTYNQQDYIRDALDSFLSQRTSFPFEIVVHDDASTDETANIIRSYAKKYPKIIVPIIEIENQYSKKNGILNQIVNSKLRGKYIAYCEGDDYWTDSGKIQRQFELMESNPDVDICAHTVQKVDANSGKICGYIQPSLHDCIFSAEDVIMGGGGFVGTNSLFFRRDILYNEPRFRKMLEIDYTLQVEGALRGGMLYMDSCMSAYRVLAKNSWSQGLNDHYIVEFRKQWLSVINQIDIDTKFKYHNAIVRYKLMDTIDTAILLKKFKMINKDCKLLFKSMKGRKRLEYFFKANCPQIFVLLKNVLRR